MAAQTRCKVKCTWTAVVGKDENGNDLYRSYFQAVYDDNPQSENGQFFKWTPSASMDLGTITQYFEAGKEYYVDFTVVEPIEAAAHAQ